MSHLPISTLKFAGSSCRTGDQDVKGGFVVMWMPHWPYFQLTSKLCFFGQ